MFGSVMYRPRLRPSPDQMARSSEKSIAGDDCLKCIAARGEAWAQWTPERKNQSGSKKDLLQVVKGFSFLFLLLPCSTSPFCLPAMDLFPRTIPPSFLTVPRTRIQGQFLFRQKQSRVFKSEGSGFLTKNGRNSPINSSHPPHQAHNLHPQRFLSWIHTSFPDRIPQNTLQQAGRRRREGRKRTWTLEGTCCRGLDPS